MPVRLFCEGKIRVWFIGVGGWHILRRKELKKKRVEETRNGLESIRNGPEKKGKGKDRSRRGGEVS